AGSSRPARMAMMAMTTSSSMRVKPADRNKLLRVFIRANNGLIGDNLHKIDQKNNKAGRGRRVSPESGSLKTRLFAELLINQTIAAGQRDKQGRLPLPRHVPW